MNDVEKIKKAVANLVENRDELEQLVDIRFEVNTRALNIALGNVNLDEVTLENFKPENSKCLCSQKELQDIRRELKKTIEYIDYVISSLGCTKLALEDMYNRVDKSCID